MGTTLRQMRFGDRDLEEGLRQPNGKSRLGALARVFYRMASVRSSAVDNLPVLQGFEN